MLFESETMDVCVLDLLSDSASETSAIVLINILSTDIFSSEEHFFLFGTLLMSMLTAYLTPTQP